MADGGILIAELQQSAGKTDSGAHIGSPLEKPFFCLLEDDNLVTRLTVSTDRLLEPVQNPSEVLLLVHVLLKKTIGTWANTSLA